MKSTCGCDLSTQKGSARVIYGVFISPQNISVFAVKKKKGLKLGTTRTSTFTPEQLEVSLNLFAKAGIIREPVVLRTGNVQAVEEAARGSKK